MSALERELEQLIKHLNDKNKLVAKSFLSWLLENQLDEEDDLLTPEDIRAIEQGRQELMKREAVPLEDLKRDLGL
ncbi:hypothetical protein [Kyrpidia spormannii]|uniref:Uncharacterized protein n=2 Tax=Kyrpidia spormannii TaxID=2055160 RepID=A0ACA8ZC88_9BACL|nr:MULTISPECIES: hypothetical protein [Kyrpidia]MBE3551909.1 hypothetical protein [Kyrpidia tusciae]CAB3394289.1 conserved protein of unknown function [Kyrpidia spormannii]CAB3395225.1 conserved protein of unknown function [Kyrpidia spormannii]